MLTYITHIITIARKQSAKRFLPFCLFVTHLILFPHHFVYADDSIKTVAITQIVAHDSLNKVRDGIIDELKQKYGHLINILLSNANANIVTASQIAAKLVAGKPDLIIAISTPSAQTVIKSARHTGIPILFATVSDPVGASLVPQLQHPGGNISGTRNSSPVKEQLLLARQIIPNLKKIGVVLSLAEANSVFMLKTLEEVAAEFKIEVQSKAVTNSSDVKLATESLVGNVDAFFLLQDNTVASSLPSFIKAATKAGKPVISSYVEAVQLGALAGLAFDEYQIGKQTGQMAIGVLEGKNPGEMAVEDPQKLELGINQKIAKALGINVPDAILKKYH